MLLATNEVMNLWWAAILAGLFGVTAFLKVKLTATKQLDRLLQLVADGEKPVHAAQQLVKKARVHATLFDLVQLGIAVVIGTIAVHTLALRIGTLFSLPTNTANSFTVVLAVFLLVGILIGISALFRSLATPKDQADEPTKLLSAEQLAFLALRSYRDGDSAGDIRRDLLTNFFHFDDIRIDKIMIPKNRMVSLPATLRVREAIDALLHTGLARFPVFDREEERVIGVIYFTDLLDAAAKESTAQIADLVNAPVLLKPDTTVTEAVKRLRTRGDYLGIVVDDSGRCIGLVGLGDLLDEIVTDQTGRRQSKPSIKKTAPGVVEADGKTIVADIIRELEIDMDHSAPKTIGAYVFERLGRIPRIGDSVDAGEMIVDVLDVSGAEATRIRATRNRLLHL